MAMSLAPLGWNDGLAAAFGVQASTRGDSDLEPARVIAEHKQSFVVRAASGELNAMVSGRFRHEATGLGDFPAVGDWLAVSARPAEGTATIHAVLPRRSAITRADPDSAGDPSVEAQVLAANVDVALLVEPIDRPVNRRRLERYLAVGWSSGAIPVVVLTKDDLAADPVGEIASVAAIAPGVAIHAVSALTGDGLHALTPHLSAGSTAVVLGPSGAGKSTLVNALLGEERLGVGEIRASDGRGRHTTTHRELFVLPSGAMLIDTPGLRSLGLLDATEGVDTLFADVEELAVSCRFGDCSHRSEPGCAITAALADGTLDPGRYESYRKLLREEAHETRRRDPKVRLAERRRWRVIQSAVGRHMDEKYGEAWRG